MTRTYDAYTRLCLFGFAMAWAYDSPWWVWVIGGLCATKLTFTTRR